MFSLNDMCSLCLAQQKSLINISSEDNNGVTLKEKLKYIFSELIDFKPDIPKYICTSCLEDLNTVYHFRKKWSQNIQTLKELAQESETESQIFQTEYNNYSNTKEEMIDEKLTDKEKTTKKEITHAVYLTENHGIKNEPRDLPENIDLDELNQEDYLSEEEVSTSNNDVYYIMNTNFGNASIEKSSTKNTKRTQQFIWNKFEDFCHKKNYNLQPTTSVEQLAAILEDWAKNMKQKNGKDYKEAVIKLLWNGAAKLLQEKYSNDYNINFHPFTDKEFKKARDARDAKRRFLRTVPSKRKKISALNKQQITQMIKNLDENTPSGLQKKFYQIAYFALNWKNCDAVMCLTSHFREERDLNGDVKRLEYNPSQNNNAIKKYLLPNTEDSDICPIRIYQKLISKRNLNKNIITDRLFLTPNPNFDKSNSVGWYKNTPVGKNIISKWIINSIDKTVIDNQGDLTSNGIQNAKILLPKGTILNASQFNLYKNCLNNFKPT